MNSDLPQYRSLAKTGMAIFQVKYPIVSFSPLALLLILTFAILEQQRGLMGFFDGASIRVSRKIFSSAISWTVYETLLVFWRDRHKLV